MYKRKAIPNKISLVSELKMDYIAAMSKERIKGKKEILWSIFYCVEFFQFVLTNAIHLAILNSD